VSIHRQGHRLLRRLETEVGDATDAPSRAIRRALSRPIAPPAPVTKSDLADKPAGNPGALTDPPRCDLSRASLTEREHVGLDAGGREGDLAGVVAGRAPASGRRFGAIRPPARRVVTDVNTTYTHSGTRAPQKLCPHCHQPIRVEAFSPRWLGYCERCARALSNHPHIESA